MGVKCTARNRQKQPCKNAPMKGSSVCHAHGGRAPQVRASAQRRLAEEQMRMALDAMSIIPVEDPLTELKKLAGQVVAWKDLLADKVHELDQYRYGGEYNEQIRGEVTLFVQALAMCSEVLGKIAKLNIDERLAAITESQHRSLEDALFSAFDEAGLAITQTEEKERVARAFARHLYVVPDPAVA